MAASVLQLKCECKNDPWGKKGSESLAGRLWSQIPGAGPLDDSESYSEMWMGTYPSVPSRVLSNDELLSDHLKRNPDLLGKESIQRYSTNLPFLPKVLSFAKALPLQMHPDKKLAEQLHAKDPIKFGDANHKPEIAVALTRFELFVGFKPTSDLTEIFKLKPLQSILPKSDKIDASFLRQACRTLLTLSPEEVADTISQTMKLPQSDFGKHAYMPALLDRLSKQYSQTDNGCLVAVLCMNFMTLEPGEAVCVPADSIHAWLSGDILECMARSDNVLNTGFCPRAERDSIDLFTQALTFQPQSSEAAILPAHPSLLGLNKKTVKYAPPFSEFNVLGVSLSGSEKETHAELQSPSILVVTQGSGKMKVFGENNSYDLKEGSVFFVGQKAKLQFSTEQELSFYRAYATS